MRLSSVMFFSFSSAMVMFTCNKEGWEWEDSRGGSAPGRIQAGFQNYGCETLFKVRPPKSGRWIETPDKSDRLCGEAAFKPLH
jgi:hypothetical protein